jgi:hypothetical protein
VTPFLQSNIANLARYCFHIPYRIAEGANSDLSVVGKVKDRRSQFIVVREREGRLAALPFYFDNRKIPAAQEACQIQV